MCEKYTKYALTRKRVVIRVSSLEGVLLLQTNVLKMRVRFVTCFGAQGHPPSSGSCQTVVSNLAALLDYSSCTTSVALCKLKKATYCAFQTRYRDTIQSLLEDSQSHLKSRHRVFQHIDC